MKDGLIYISKLANKRVEKVEVVVAVRDMVSVTVVLSKGLKTVGKGAFRDCTSLEAQIDFLSAFQISRAPHPSA